MKLGPLDNRVAKYMPFKTRADADAHVAAHIDNYPDAFVLEDEDSVPVEDPASWRFNPATKKVLDRVRRFRPEKEKSAVFVKANAEYLRRAARLLNIKLRGSSLADGLSAAAIKEMFRDGPNAALLAGLHDKSETLKDQIDLADSRAMLDSIDVTADGHWT